MSRFLAKYPSTSAGAIGTFYDNAAKVDEVVQTLNRLSQHNPKQFVQYYQANRDYLALASMISSTRTDLADARRAIEDVKHIPGLSPDRRRKLIDTYTEHMIRAAKLANGAAKTIIR